jgi:hypothetical protein
VKKDFLKQKNEIFFPLSMREEVKFTHLIIANFLIRVHPLQFEHYQSHHLTNIMYLSFDYILIHKVDIILFDFLQYTIYLNDNTDVHRYVKHSI